MTDATSSGSDAGGHASQLNDIHCINNVLYGHLGRISYTPSVDDEKGTGELTSGRAVVDKPHFHQVSSFSEWLGPSKSISPIGSSEKASQSIRSQERWLLKSHPEAYLGNDELRESLAKEIPLLKTSRGHTAALSLLAVGEIHDKSSSWKSRACPALAMAAGEAGHILRISTLQYERWGWDADNTHEISLATTGSGDQGFWCADGVPITKIQFANVRKRYDQIRWLIVQKPTSTTIFQPEVRKQPVGEISLPCYLDSEKTSHISANPIITITQEDTSGRAHCDFSFNPGSGNLPPQIAIVDQAGGWTVWDIRRERWVQKTTLKPALRISGWLTGEYLLGNHITTKSSMAETHFRAFWVTQNNTQSDTWDDPGSPSEDSAVHDHLQAAPSPGFDMPTPRCDMLLLCDHKNLQLVDVGSGTSVAPLEMTKQGTADRILDAKVSFHNPSYAFVLTKSTLYWLDVFPSHLGGARRPTILLSCPHYWHGHKDDLKLTLISERPNRDNDISLVTVFSSSTLRLGIFWFIQSVSGATFHHQTVHIGDFAGPVAGRVLGLESVVFIPAPLSKRKTKANHHSPPVNPAKDNTRFLQIIGVGSDLSLNSCLVTVSANGSRQTTQPNTRIDPWKRDPKRTRFLQEVGESFVVPDHIEPSSSLMPIHQGASSAGQRIPQFRRLQLWRFVGRLFRDVAHALPSKAADALHNGTTAMQQVARLVDDTLEGNGADGYVPLRPLFDLIAREGGHFDIGSVEPQWTAALRKLAQTDNARLQVLVIGQYKANLNVGDLFEALSIMWSARLPADHLRPALWRRIEFALERIAIETYLSGRAIRLVPEKLLLEPTPNVEETAEGLETPASQSKVESALPTPSTSPSSAQSSVSGQLASDKAEQEDPVIMRLRTYATSIKPSGKLKPGESRLLSHWPKEIGHNPNEYAYIPEESRRRDAERVKAWRKQQEDRRRRRAASQALLKQEESGDSSSQPLPRYAYSSQPHPPSSQSQGPITMSQPTAGQHGARPTMGKKKAKKARRVTGGFR